MESLLVLKVFGIGYPLVYVKIIAPADSQWILDYFTELRGNNAVAS